MSRTKNPNTQHVSNQPGEMVCLLSGPELQERKASLQKEVFAKMIRNAETENGFIFYFMDEGDFVHVLMDYVLAEKMCCPFLQYDLQILPDGEGLSLGVSGEGPVKEFLKTMIQSDD